MALAPDALLIDGDILAYRAAAQAEETVDWEDGTEPQVFLDKDTAFEAIDRMVYEYIDILDCDRVIIYLSHDVNFRKQLWPDYKANRKDAKRPALVDACKQYFRDTFNSCCLPRLEADDAMGIDATGDAFDFPVIVSVDKDMRTIPGWLFNPDKDDKPNFISREEAFHFHMFQTLAGDATDNIRGCPGIGPVKAAAIIGPVENKLSQTQFDEWRKELWSRVLTTFAMKYPLTKPTPGATATSTPPQPAQTTATMTASEAALLNARLTKILQAGSYNPKTSKIRLWSAPC